MKLFSKNVVFVVRDNLMGSYYLDLGYFINPVESGFGIHELNDFVSVKTFSKVDDMINHLESYDKEEFSFTMAIDPLVPDYIMDKYFREN